MTEKELILTSLLNCRRIDLYVDQKLLTETQEKALQDILTKRNSGEPLQYILGNSEFMGLKLFVDSRVLIPRPETELLVQAVIDYANARKNKFFHILDIGTGSGNIAIALAKNIASCYISAVDISKEALTVAAQNAKFNSVENKIEFIRNDSFPFINNPSEEKMFDIIVSNPPYIASGQMNGLPRDVHREPSIALDGGPEGLDFYRHIIKEAPNFLKQKGLLCFEIGDKQKKAIEKIFERYQVFHVVDCIKDYSGTERIFIAELKNHG